MSYHIHMKTAYYMHGKVIFLRINTTSFCFYLAYYLYPFSWDHARLIHNDTYLYIFDIILKSVLFKFKKRSHKILLFLSTCGPLDFINILIASTVFKI